MTKSLHIAEDQKAPNLSVEELSKELEEAYVFFSYVSWSVRSGHPYTVEGVWSTGPYSIGKTQVDQSKLQQSEVLV